MKKLCKNISFVLICVCLFASCGSQEPEKTEKVSTATNVSIYKVSKTGITSTVSYAGTLSPLESVSISSKIGAKALSVNVKEGDYVTAGTVLLTLDSTDLENAYPNIRNYNVAVKKRGEDITFLRRIISGGADDSYGIEVAKLAGIPNSVVKRAREILSALEEGKEVEKISRMQENNDLFGQTNLFASVTSDAERIIRQTDVETLTPIEALNLLYELKSIVK